MLLHCTAPSVCCSRRTTVPWRPVSRQVLPRRVTRAESGDEPESLPPEEDWMAKAMAKAIKMYTYDISAYARAWGPLRLSGEAYPDVSYSRFKVGMACACRVLHVRPGQGAFVHLLPTGWAETVPPKTAYLPQFQFTHGPPKGFAIEHFLREGMLIKAHIFRISERGVLVCTKSMERVSGEMVTAPLECFGNAKSLEVGQMLERSLGAPPVLPLNDSGRNKRLRKGGKEQGIERAVILGHQWKDGRSVPSVQMAAWPLWPFPKASHMLKSLSADRRMLVSGFSHAAEDVMAQHVRQAVLTPAPQLELHPPSDKKTLAPPDAEAGSAISSLHSLAHARACVVVPGGADALVPQHSFRPRSMGAPHEAASVTARASSLCLEGELVCCISERVGHILASSQRGSQDTRGLAKWQREVVRVSRPPFKARHVSRMRSSFPDDRRWCLLVRDACMGARARLLALSDHSQGRSDKDTLRWRSLALSLLQLAKADLLALGSSRGGSGQSGEEVGGGRPQAVRSNEEDEGGEEGEDEGVDDGEEQQAAQGGVEGEAQQQAAQARVDAEGEREEEALHNHPGMLASFAFVAGFGACTPGVGGVPSTGSSVDGSSDRVHSTPCVWSPVKLGVLQGAPVDGCVLSGQREEQARLLQACAHKQVLESLARGLSGSAERPAGVKGLS